MVCEMRDGGRWEKCASPYFFFFFCSWDVVVVIRLVASSLMPDAPEKSERWDETDERN